MNEEIKSKLEKVTFSGCSDEQATWAGGKDPRKLLEKGQVYEIVKTEVYEWHTHYYIEVDGKEVPFNSACFGEWEEKIIELPKKLEAMIADTDNAFVVRIGTEPRTTDTGIANVICQGLERQKKDYVIQLAKHFVQCWNKYDTLQAKADLFDEAIKALEAARTAIYDALHAGNLSRSYSGCVSEKVEKVLAKAKAIK